MLRHIPLLSLLLLPLLAQAQGDLPSEQVTVIKNFEAQLAETERIEISPELPPLDTARQRQEYTLPYKSLDLDYPAPTIRPIAVRTNDVPDSYDGQIKLGAGYPASLYANGSYHYLFEDKLDLGINVLHHSANSNNLENQRFSLYDVNGKGTYYFDQGFAVQAGLGYVSDEVSFYGYNFDTTLIGRNVEREDVRQRFSIFSFNGNVFNGERTVGDINYSAGVDFYQMRDYYATSESGFDLKIKGTKYFAEKHALDLVIRTDFTRYEDTLVQNLHNFFLAPAFTFHSDVLRVKLGGSVASHDDEFFFFPDIQATVNILGNNLAAFAGAEGTLQKNTFRSLTNYNPFLASRIQIANTRLYHFFGGVKGNLGFVEYSAQAGYKKADDLALFLLEATPENVLRKRFDVLYDTVTIYNIQGNIFINLLKDLRIHASVNQNIYDPAQQEKAWHLPAFTLNAGATYQALDDKLSLRGELFIENGVPFLNEAGLADNLNGLFDVSLGAHYLIGEHFGLFLDINNLANNRRQRWQDYPTFGINVLGGATLRF